MRNLASIRTIISLDPIPDADQIHTATVDGWKVVVRKDEGFIAGDIAVYLEIDSLVPDDDPRFSFLQKTKFRVKTIKLRKQISQGVLLPIAKLTDDELSRLDAGEDLTTILRIQKYEPAIPLGGQQKGNFPVHIVPKTDQDRIQNIRGVLYDKRIMNFEITEKLDGTSATFFYCRREEIKIGACSRNWEMKLEDDNVYTRIFRKHNLEDKLRKLDRNIAIQGEIIGPQIQSNKYKLATQEFYVFDIWDIDTRSYLGFWERWELVKKLELYHVPVIQDELEERINPELYNNYMVGETPLCLDLVLDLADGKSMLADIPREGLVFKSNNGDLSFKVVSNTWLLANDG